MTEYSIWAPYTGVARLALGLALTVVAALLLIVGLRLRVPRAARTGGILAGIFLAVIWLLDVLVMRYVTAAYSLAVYQQAGKQTAVANPITRFTLFFAVVVFVCVFVWVRKPYGWKIALVSAVAGAGTGPVMFELPFDWIIMFHLKTPDPVALYRWVYFLPLFLFSVATLALLTLTPAARLRRETLFALAAMFLLWAGWAWALGFAHPSAPLPIAFNVASKLAAAVAGLLIFLPMRARVTASSGPAAEAVIPARP